MGNMAKPDSSRQALIAPRKKAPPPPICTIPTSFGCDSLVDEYDLFSPGVDTPGHRAPGAPPRSPPKDIWNEALEAVEAPAAPSCCMWGTRHRKAKDA
eukprot:gene20382-27153_t